MNRVEYSEGSGLLVVQQNRLLFLSSAGPPSALNLEVAAFLGEDPIRSLAVCLANEDTEVPPFIFLTLADDLRGVVCGDIQLKVHEQEELIFDGATEEFWMHISTSPSATVSSGQNIGHLWLDSGSARASSFRWQPIEDTKRPLVLVHETSTDETNRTTKRVEALVCFDCHSPNPLMTARCRSCKAFLTEDNSGIKSVGQPALGAIHLSDGRIEPLDADLLIGRNPDRYGLEPHQRAIVHGTSDQSISRRHLELRREGWRVMVLCLKQPSGSAVQSRLGGRTALQFGVPHQLSDGDIIHFGSASFRYEQNALIIQGGPS